MRQMLSGVGLPVVRPFAVAMSIFALAGAAAAQNAAPKPVDPLATQQSKIEPTGREIVQADAIAVRDQVKSDLAKEFLDGAALLPDIPTQTYYGDPATRTWMTEADAKALSEEARAKLKPRVCDDRFYYLTRHGTPAAYVRAIDVFAALAPDFKTWKGKKVADFGYGTIGHLRMLAADGASCTGIDVDTLLGLMYADMGPMPSRDPQHPGGVQVATGQWPAEEKMVKQVGDGYDLFISKNTLKNGYINPEREVDPRMLIKLGVSNDQYVAELARIVKPGGYVLIYNICPAPAPADKPYIPWADGRCPFPKEMWAAHGFDVLAFDVKDDEAARKMGRAFGWDKVGEDKVDPDFDTKFFAWYTVLRHK